MTICELQRPSRFCWTRFGIESGESVESILARKERERQDHGGMFLWGIGNSVGPAVRELVRLEQKPMVFFSPMRSKPKNIDVAPAAVLTWTRAITLSNEEWEIPEGLQVVSRAGTDGGTNKRSHYALVCRSDVPLHASGSFGELDYDSLVNMLSHNKLGHSQVTSVVQCNPVRESTGARYPIGFVAELVYPYFVKLFAPMPVEDGQTSQASSAATGTSPRRGYQESFLPA